MIYILPVAILAQAISAQTTGARLLPFPCTRACAYGPSGGSSVCSATAPCRRGAPAATTPTPTASLQRAGATAPSAARPPKREAVPKAQRRYEHRRKGRVAEKAREVVPKAAEKTVHARASPRAEAAHSRQQVAVSKSSTTVAKEALGQDSKVVQKFHHRRHRRSSIRNRMALQAHQGYSHLKKHGQEAMQRCTPCSPSTTMWRHRERHTRTPRKIHRAQPGRR